MAIQWNGRTVFIKNVQTGKYLIVDSNNYGAVGTKPQPWTLQATGDPEGQYLLKTKAGEYLNGTSEDGDVFYLAPNQARLNPLLIGYQPDFADANPDSGFLYAFFNEPPGIASERAILMLVVNGTAVVGRYIYEGLQNWEWQFTDATDETDGGDNNNNGGTTTDGGGTPGTVPGDTVPVTTDSYAVITALNNEEWNREVHLEFPDGVFDFPLGPYEVVHRRIAILKGDLKLVVRDSKRGALDVRHTSLDPLGKLDQTRVASTITFVARKAAGDETTDADVVVHVDFDTNALKNSSK